MYMREFLNVLSSGVAVACFGVSVMLNMGNLNVVFESTRARYAYALCLEVSRFSRQHCLELERARHCVLVTA